MNETGNNPNESALDNGQQAGRYAPRPEVLPEPTYWPVILAAGITFTAWGVVTSFLLSILGLGMSAVALVNWIGDIRHEQEHESGRQ
jgi:hypothetical protein